MLVEAGLGPLGATESSPSTRGLEVTVVPAVIAIAILAGLIAHGSLRRFEHQPLHWWGLALIGLGLQTAPFSESRVALAALLASYVLLLAVGLVNRRLVAAPLLLIGLALNLAVVVPNKGMPVSESAVRSLSAGVLPASSAVSGKHHLQTDTDVLAALGDVIPVPAPFKVVLSVGDLFLYAGVVVFVVSVMLGRPGENYRRPARLVQMYRGKHLSAHRRPSRAPVLEAPSAIARSGT
jgi:Family of unknown function (DUF5317)